MSIIYLRLRKSITIQSASTLRLKDLAYISVNSPELDVNSLRELVIYQIQEKDLNMLSIDGFIIVERINEKYPSSEVQLLGPGETLVTIKPKPKKHLVIMTIFVWLILFIGTAMTIMNFHYDVSMSEVQQKLHYLITGKESEYPLWIQVPYSIGLGLGMLLFFNHWFRKRFNEEPSPLEVEVFKYEQELKNYANHNENVLYDRDNN